MKWENRQGPDLVVLVVGGKEEWCLHSESNGKHLLVSSGRPEIKLNPFKVHSGCCVENRLG